VLKARQIHKDSMGSPTRSQVKMPQEFDEALAAIS
jgi:hypothetical protein